MGRGRAHPTKSPGGSETPPYKLNPAHRRPRFGTAVPKRLGMRLAAAGVSLGGKHAEPKPRYGGAGLGQAATRRSEETVTTELRVPKRLGSDSASGSACHSPSTRNLYS